MLDHRLSEFDLRLPRDRHAFCAIQFSAFLRVGEACRWDAAEATEALSRTVAALSEETERHGRPQGEPDAPLSPDAVAYVTLGSQLGLSVLRTSLPEAERSGLFALAPDAAAWRGFRQRLASDPPAGEEAARILSDAERIFDIFLQETDRQTSARLQATE